MLLGCSSVYLLCRCSSNYLLCEVNQLCLDGVLRSVALDSTDGLSTYGVLFLILYQPMLVQVGCISLGRLYNVTGSSMDFYINMDRSIALSLSSCVSYTSSDKQRIVESVILMIGSYLDISEYNTAKSYSSYILVIPLF